VRKYKLVQNLPKINKNVIIAANIIIICRRRQRRHLHKCATSASATKFRTATRERRRGDVNKARQQTEALCPWSSARTRGRRQRQRHRQRQRSVQSTVGQVGQMWRPCWVSLLSYILQTGSSAISWYWYKMNIRTLIIYLIKKRDFLTLEAVEHELGIIS